MMAAPMRAGPRGALGAAMPTPMIPGGLAAAHGVVAERPRTNGLQGSAAYADGRNDLTAEQIKIGYAFSNNDRATALTLVRASHNSLDFVIFRDSTTTPLLFAARSADSEMIAAILAKGVPVDSTKSTAWRSNETALIAVVDSTFAGHFSQVPTSPERFLETARFLLKAGANPNAKRSDGNTPLNTALRLMPPSAERENVKIAMVKLLLEGGAKPDTELPSNDFTGETDVAILNLLFAHGFDSKAHGSTALASAVQLHRPALVRLLLEKGADPNAHALMASRKVIADADAPTARLLLAAGANPNVCDDEDSSGKCATYGHPLIFGALGDPEYFRLLIAKGADPNAQNGQGQTILGEVIRHRSMREQGIQKICVAGTSNCMDTPEETFDRVKAARMVLDAGADPNKRSGNQVPLMMADENDHALFGVLLDKGARPETLIVEGEKIGPISQVIMAHRDYLAGELLRRTPGKLGSEEKWGLFRATIDGRLDMAETLVRRGVSPNERTPFGETALHYAAMSRQGAAAVKRLLALGADPNAQTDALPEAVLSSGTPVPQIQAKQKIYAAAQIGGTGLMDGKITPLMLAVLSANTEAAQALLDGGAKVSLKSQRGWTASDLASRMGNREMVQLLGGRP